MARYKNYSYDQMVMLPISFDRQIMPGTFEEAINQIVDKHIDLTIFESRYKNDETGRCAYDPAILLKIVLLAYSRGITGSRRIEQACNENVVFMAISADTHPDHSTIAAFISKMEKEIKGIFCDILIVCDEMGLIGGTMFAIDGCKLPSNASKEWSGTKADFEKKKTKLERTIKYLMEEHKTKDKEENKFDIGEEEKDARIKKLQNKIEKITKWMKENKDKEGSKGTAIKSNITDNESAKMVSSHGVIQGYNGIAAADSKHQVIVSAEVYGDGNDQKVLKDVIEKTEEGLTAIGKDLKDTKIIADSGFHNKDNVHMLDEKGLDAYIPDKEFRKRDPRFITAERHRKQIYKYEKESEKKYFSPGDFKYDEEKKKLICPAGSELYVCNSKYKNRSGKAIAYRAKITACRVCELRIKCLRNAKTVARQVHIFYDRTKNNGQADGLVDKMKAKIDSVTGRYIYSKRMGIIEPVFGNVKQNKGLNRFTLRGNKKVNIQWKLFAIIHNIGKLYNYGLAIA